MTYVREITHSEVFENIDYTLQSTIVKYFNILIIRIYLL